MTTTPQPEPAEQPRSGQVAMFDPAAPGGWRYVDLPAALSDTVRVGPADTNVLLRSTADHVLALLFERHREIFGALAAEAITGEAIGGPRRRHRATGEGEK